MPSDASKRIFDEALSLPEPERARLAHESWFHRLLSGDAEEILDALAEIDSDRSAPPPPEVVARCIELFNHTDPDVRHDAVRAISIHWGHRDSLEPLILLSRQESDEYVVMAAVFAIGRIGKDHSDLMPRSTAALACLGLALDRSLEIRALAFAEARVLCGDADATEIADVTSSPSTNDIDLAWLRLRCPEAAG